MAPPSSAKGVTMTSGATIYIEMQPMKHWINLALAAIAGALLLSACAVEQERETAPEAFKTVWFKAGLPGDPSTRTAFDEATDGIYPTRWTERDTAVSVSLNYASPVEARVSPAPDFKSAGFAYEAGNVTASEYTFRIVTPSSAVRSMSPSRFGWQVGIPAIQTPSANSPDEAAQILCAVTSPLSEIPQTLDVHFYHVTSYGKISLRNLPEDITINSITLSCSVPLAGTWYRTDSGEMTPKDASSTIEIVTSSSQSVWFACAPVDVSGATLKVIINCPEATYEKSIRFNEGRSFKPGKVASFAVDFAGVEPLATGERYVLVTDESTLADGDEILLLDKNGLYAISTNQKKSNRGAGDVTIANGAVVEVPETAETFILKGIPSAWTIQIASSGQYLYTQSGKANILCTQDGTIMNLAEWVITIDYDGTATIRAPYTGGSRFMMLNHNDSNNLLFSCYTNLSVANTRLMSIYRKETSTGSVYTGFPVLEQKEYGSYLSSGNKLFNSVTDQLSREYSSDGLSVTFSILTPESFSVREYAGIPAEPMIGDSFVLTITEYQGVKTVVSNHRVMVVRVDGPKVWLADSAGNGFIVKK